MRFLPALFAAALLTVIAGCGGGIGGNGAVTLAYDNSAPAAGATAASRSISRAAASSYGSGLHWHSASGQPNQRGQALFSILKNASAHGLRPDFYLPADLLTEQRLTRTSASQARGIDRALTQGLYEFAGDVKFGRFNPNRPNSTGAFQSALASSNLTSWIDRNQPQGKSYRELKARMQLPTLSPTQRSIMALNLERLRWVQEDAYSGPTIRVNIADALIEMFRGNRRVDTMRAVIGRESRPTPLLVDPIMDLKFSPDWTVPPTVIEEDFLPRLRSNPNHFNAQEYDVRVNGVHPRQISDWSSITASDVFIRRASSDAGPLGGVRFSMYNPDSIFLHDTPAKGLFSREFRAYSSGCIRVQRAEDLALWIAQQQPNALSREEVQERMNSGTTTVFKLDVPIAVSLLYMTAYVDGGGQLRFTPDPYSWDRGLARQMGLARSSARTLVNDLPPYDLGP